jgi:LysR family transcriptional regulator, transcription activator of glutamate synthase operon
VDTDALRWFQQVAEGVTVTEVSEIDMVTQSGVSRALARLESEIGSPLLRRSGRTLKLTHAGAAFKNHVDAMLRELDDGLAVVHELADPERGSVTVAFQLSLGTWLIPALLRSFLERHPDVRFNLKQVRDELMVSALAKDDVDFEISALRPENARAQWRQLVVEPLRLAVSNEHRLRARTKIELAEVSAEKFVMLRPSTLLHQLSERLCAEAGFVPIIGFEGDDLPTVRGLVAAGLGVAIVPAPRTGSPDTATSSLHHLEITTPNAFREVGLTWLETRRLLPAAQLFRKHVIDQAAAGLVPALVEQESAQPGPASTPSL